MIKTVFFRKREDGVKLYLTRSDSGMMIRKDGTDQLYAEAIDIENSGNTYTETDISVYSPEDELTLYDAMQMLGELGVDIDDD